MYTRHLYVLVVAVGLVLAGCTGPTQPSDHEPWTGPSRLQHERARPPTLAKELRERLMENQIDR